MGAFTCYLDGKCLWGQSVTTKIGMPAVLAFLTLVGCGDKESNVVEDEPRRVSATTENTVPARFEDTGGSFGEQFYALAAERLEVTAEALGEALGTPPDFGAAAEKLGIAVEKIREAMPRFGGGFGGGFGRLEELFAQAAEVLEIGVERLTEALGTPPDLEAAAEKLEISLEKLQEALPFFRGGFAGRESRQQN